MSTFLLQMSGKWHKVLPEPKLGETRGHTDGLIEEHPKGSTKPTESAVCQVGHQGHEKSILPCEKYAEIASDEQCPACEAWIPAVIGRFLHAHLYCLAPTPTLSCALLITTLFGSVWSLYPKRKEKK